MGSKDRLETRTLSSLVFVLSRRSFDPITPLCGVVRRA
jgi:hypothetical protein